MTLEPLGKGSSVLEELIGGNELPNAMEVSNVTVIGLDDITGRDRDDTTGEGDWDGTSTGGWELGIAGTCVGMIIGGGSCVVVIEDG